MLQRVGNFLVSTCSATFRRWQHLRPRGQQTKGNFSSAGNWRLAEHTKRAASRRWHLQYSYLATPALCCDLAGENDQQEHQRTISASIHGGPRRSPVSGPVTARQPRRSQHLARCWQQYRMGNCERERKRGQSGAASQALEVCLLSPPQWLVVCMNWHDLIQEAGAVAGWRRRRPWLERHTPRPLDAQTSPCTGFISDRTLAAAGFFTMQGSGSVLASMNRFRQMSHSRHAPGMFATTLFLFTLGLTPKSRNGAQATPGLSPRTGFHEGAGPDIVCPSRAQRCDQCSRWIGPRGYRVHCAECYLLRRAAGIGPRRYRALSADYSFYCRRMLVNRYFRTGTIDF